MVKRADVEEIDCCDLAAYLIGMSDYEDDEEVWDAFYEEYNIEPDVFTRLIGELLPLINIGTSPLTENAYKGFMEPIKDGLGLFFVKMEIDKGV